MKKCLALALSANLLSGGCATPYTPQMQAADAQQCRAWGDQPGTGVFKACMGNAKYIRELQQEQKNKQVAKVLLAGALIAGGVAIAANNPGYFGGSSYPGNCQYSWQRDSRGRLCGNRAADKRPGGY